MADKPEAPDNGITYDDEGQPQGSPRDLVRYHALRGEFTAAFLAMVDAVPDDATPAPTPAADAVAEERTF